LFFIIYAEYELYMIATTPMIHQTIELRHYRRGVRPQSLAETELLHSKAISRLLTAAVISPKFCCLLLADPMSAINVGYAGEMFDLTAEEIEQICLIKASSLQEFSTQLLAQSPGRLEAVVQPERVRWQDKFYATA
jgi:hypothetical protein